MKLFVLDKKYNRVDQIDPTGLTFADLPPTGGYVQYEISGTKHYLSLDSANVVVTPTEEVSTFVPDVSFLTTRRPSVRTAEHVTEHKTDVLRKMHKDDKTIGFRLKGFGVEGSHFKSVFFVDGFCYPLMSDDYGHYLGGALGDRRSGNPHVTALRFNDLDYYLNGFVDTTDSSFDLVNETLTLKLQSSVSGCSPLISIAGLLFYPDEAGISYTDDTIVIDYATSGLLSLVTMHQGDLKLDDETTISDTLTSIITKVNTFVIWLPVTQLTSTQTYFSARGDAVMSHPVEFMGYPLVISGLRRVIDYVQVSHPEGYGIQLLSDDMVQYFAAKKGIYTSGLTPSEQEVTLRHIAITYNA